MVQQNIEGSSARRSPKSSTVKDVANEKINCSERRQKYIDDREETKRCKKLTHKKTFKRQKRDQKRPNPFTLQHCIKNAILFTRTSGAAEPKGVVAATSSRVLKMRDVCSCPFTAVPFLDCGKALAMSRLYSGEKHL
jgi:hypothetical protein